MATSPSITVQKVDTVLIKALVPGPPGQSAAAAAAYVHNQASSSFVWTINHNLGYEPITTVFNAGGQQVAVMIENPTVNQTVVTSNISFSGSARLF